MRAWCGCCSGFEHRVVQERRPCLHFLWSYVLRMCFTRKISELYLLAEMCFVGAPTRLPVDTLELLLHSAGGTNTSPFSYILRQQLRLLRSRWVCRVELQPAPSADEQGAGREALAGSEPAPAAAAEQGMELECGGQLLTLRRRSGLQAKGRLRQLLLARPRARGIVWVV